jgi:hypothetical protein
VSVSDTLPLAGSVGAVGLNVQLVPLGRFEHWRATTPAAPFCEFSVILKLVDCPADAVAEAGETYADPPEFGVGIIKVFEIPLVAVGTRSMIPGGSCART